jgi:hypothetical protein
MREPKKNKLNKYFAVSVVLLPILDIYGIGIRGLSVGKVIVLLIILLGFITKQYSIPKYPKYYLPYFLYMFIVPFVYIFTASASITNIIYKSIGSLFFAFSLGYAFGYVDLKYLIKTYEKTVIISSFFFLIQEISYFTFGVRILGLIPHIPLADTSSIDIYIDILSNINRSSSFFLEPAHFAQYILAYLVLNIFSNKGIFINTNSIFISIILILLRSGNGYLGLLLIWSIYYFLCVINKKHILKVILSVVLILVSIYITFNLQNNEIVSSITSRTSELSGTEENSSGYARIYKGYALYGNLPFQKQLMGVGQGNLESFIANNFALYHLYFEGESIYLNGIQQLICYGGIVGFILFFVFNFNLMHKNSINGKMLIMLMILFYFIAQTYNSSTVLFILILASLYKKQTCSH